MKKCKSSTTLESIDKWMRGINSGILKPKANTFEKYSGLPDEEINHLIAEKVHDRKIDRGINKDVFIPKVCSNYYDAFNLMVNNDISLEKCLNGWMATLDAIHTHNKNPCRAIAECYLLIRDVMGGE